MIREIVSYYSTLFDKAIITKCLKDINANSDQIYDPI
ncbi:hypothetical protein SAMN06265348_12023 [Pedobacter westerhofensis]|uniref:Uncharacterized protein n=1 Tax=Pedobacter westerhofensis TaxID=425512 RepID=A0A521FSP8_9SPHI|nr:hypothetical protein SAMN06265348_12023 [Pedobacter westerhofensis]